MFNKINWILLIVLFACTPGLYSQQAEVMIKVKDTVNVGTPFSLEIELKNVQGTFKSPEFQGLRLVGGPNTSSSFSIINGETTSKSTYAYFLMAEEPGSYLIKLHDIETGGEILSIDEIEVTAVSGNTGDSSLIKYYESPSKSEQKMQSSKRKIRKI